MSAEACGSSGDVEAHADAASDAPVGDDGEAAAQTTPFTDVAMRAAAQAYNAKYCAAFATWDPHYFRFTFGLTSDAAMATCMAAGGLVAIATDEARSGTEADPGAPYAQRRFLDDVRAPYAHGSELTPDTLRACADALDLSSPRAWVTFFRERIVPDACVPAFYGSLADDMPCGGWNQCISGRCLQESNVAAGSCGRCVRQQVDKCSVDACGPGSTCRATTADTMSCTQFADVGETCTPNTPGRSTLRSTPRPCHDDLICTTTGTCATPPAGDACDPSVGCSFVPYLRYCNAATSRCEPIAFANVGQPCGPIQSATGGFIPCSYGSTCTQVDPPAGVGADSAAPPSPYYRCVPLLEDGQACVGSVDHDSPCKSPGSRCFQDTCQKNGPAECTAPAVLP